MYDGGCSLAYIWKYILGAERFSGFSHDPRPRRRIERRESLGHSNIRRKHSRYADPKLHLGFTPVRLFLSVAALYRCCNLRRNAPLKVS
jgi:hypothetical protein